MSQAAAASWPTDVVEAVAKFKQGDIIQKPPPFSYFGDVANPLPPLRAAQTTAHDRTERAMDFIETEYDYGIITSQTCDLVEEGVPAQPCFQACPVVKLERRPDALPEYLAPLDPPDLPVAAWVADLRVEVPFEKTVLVGREPVAAFDDEAGYVDFARRLGRRKERPAVASSLVNAVAATLKKRKTNSQGFKRLMRDHIHSVRLAIDEGTRLQPAVASVHFIGRGPIPDDAREKLETWWQVAYTQAEAEGISLLPNGYHDSTQMDIDVLERTIPLSV